MMARPPSSSDNFRSAVLVLRSAVAERRERRLTPVAPAPPRASSPEAGEALPEHTRDADGERVATLPPGASAWAETDSDDGAPRR
jgi:hypothetical protein